MFGHGPLNGFRVPAKSINDIRYVANRARIALGLTFPIPLGRFLEQLSSYSITLDVLEDGASGLPPGVEACWIPETFTLCLTQKVYDRACMNDPRALFTVFHEIGHALLGHKRTLNREVPGREFKTFEDSEWQANQFAAEILMPLDEIRTRGLRTEQDLVNAFGVSMEASRIRIDRLKKHREM
ncbi:ImmA/IrrE family metallo-endopeptidase [Paraburkholderia sp. JHI869]|uniref:ImmA/IrrE family metallo-endopeptidase n=1 Tax=Paraburkholderia sp. JHI869 TaxID=3112959 RepID=UPI00317BF475